MICNNSSASSLTASIDWLGFTFPVGIQYLQVFEILPFDIHTFKNTGHGGNGYKIMFIDSNNIKIYTDGNENMGIHVEISGSAIAYFINCFKESFNDGFYCFNDDMDLLRYILRFLRELGCNFSRLDINIDDIGNKFFSVDDVVKHYENGHISTRYKDCNIHKGSNTGDLSASGNTIYFGSRTSDSMIRVYDKQLEQNKKLDAEHQIAYPWTRWEFELKNKKACKFIDEFINGQSLNVLFFSLLDHMMRIHNADDCNVSRCTTLPLWEEFISSAERFSFNLPKPDKSLEKTEQFLIKQCMPSLCNYLVATGALPVPSRSQIRRIIIKGKHNPAFSDYFDESTINALYNYFGFSHSEYY